MKLTVEQLARRMAVHPETIRRWARIRRIPAMKLGGPLGDWRFDLEKIEKFEKKNITKD